MLDQEAAVANARCFTWHADCIDSGSVNPTLLEYDVAHHLLNAGGCGRHLLESCGRGKLQRCKWDYGHIVVVWSPRKDLGEKDTILPTRTMAKDDLVEEKRDVGEDLQVHDLPWACIHFEPGAPGGPNPRWTESTETEASSPTHRFQASVGKEAGWLSRHIKDFGAGHFYCSDEVLQLC